MIKLFINYVYGELEIESRNTNIAVLGSIENL